MKMRATFHTFFFLYILLTYSKKKEKNTEQTKKHVSLLTRKLVQVFIYYGRMFDAVLKSDAFLMRVQNSHLWI